MNIGIEKVTTQEFESYNSSADKFGSEKFGFDKFGSDKFGFDKFGSDKFVADKFGSDKFGVDKFTTGLNFEPSTSRYQDLGLDDGKSSSALLAELKGFASSNKDVSYTSNSYDYASTSYYKPK
jgi:hypothetical protein